MKNKTLNLLNGTGHIPIPTGEQHKIREAVSAYKHRLDPPNPYRRRRAEKEVPK